MRKLIVFLLGINIPISYASCGLPQSIIGSEASVLQGEIKLEYIDKDLFESYGVDLLEIKIPKYYKELEIGKVLLTYWDKDKVISHANLGALYEASRTVNTYEFSVNRYSKASTVLTVIYGKQCYSRYRLNIGDLSNYKIDFDSKWEQSTEKQNSVFKKSANK